MEIRHLSDQIEVTITQGIDTEMLPGLLRLDHDQFAAHARDSLRLSRGDYDKVCQLYQEVDYIDFKIV